MNRINPLYEVVLSPRKLIGIGLKADYFAKIPPKINLIAKKFTNIPVKHLPDNYYTVEDIPSEC